MTFFDTEKPKVLALDLEGTLVSNAVSQFPRPGLARFLEFCRSRFERLALFTSVTEGVTRQVLRTLVEEGELEEWVLSEIGFVIWSRARKRLSFVPDARPEEVLLLDDQPRVIPLEHHERWIHEPEFMPPFNVDYGELMECECQRLDACCEPATEDGLG